MLEGASGFLYYVSVAGVTGANAATASAVRAAVERLKRATDLPIAVGFGVREPEAARAIAQTADAVVVGSAFVDEIAAGPGGPGGRTCLAQGRSIERSCALGAGTGRDTRMNWLSNFARPGLSKKKPEDARDTPDNLWIKDPLSGELIYRAELEASDWVTPSGFHMRIGPDARFKQMFDEQAWQTIPLPKVAADPLKFKDDKKYVDRLKAARAKVHREDCMAAGYGRIGGAHAVVLVQDFEFMGGSLGMAAGEAFIARG